MSMKEYWITNISKMNVSLLDLNLTIKSLSSINLLDKKHYSYTLDQLELSRTKGSMYKKRNKIVVRNISPEYIKINIPISREASIPSRDKSIYEIKNETYEELTISDEQFAEENADMVELDVKPLIVKN